MRVLAISSNDPERYLADSFEAMVERVQQEGGWPHPYLYDENQQVAREWGAERTPEVFVLDSGLQLRSRGAPDADYDDPSQEAAWLRAALDAVLAGREPDRRIPRPRAARSSGSHEAMTARRLPRESGGFRGLRLGSRTIGRESSCRRGS